MGDDNYDTYIMFAGVYSSVDAAESDYQAVKDLYYGTMSRGDLKDLGEELDQGEAALIVAAASDVSDKVAAAITKADKVLQKQAKIDADDLSAELNDAKSD